MTSPEQADYDDNHSSSGDVLDHLDELIGGVSLSAGELDQLVDFLDDGAAFGGAGDGDAAAAA